MKHNWKIPYRELGVMMALQFFIAINHLMFFNKNSEKAEKHAIFFGKKKKNPSLNTAKRFAWVQKG